MDPILEQEIRAVIRDELQGLMKPDRYVFTKNIELLDARKIQLGKTNGTKIGTEATQKIGFYGVTPVIQAGAIASPSGGATVDGAARAAIDSLRTAIKNIGITA